MKTILQFIVFILFGLQLTHGQLLSFTPEIVLGTRSHTYQHYINYSFDSNWSINNVTLFDAEYFTEGNTIFFIRNMLAYKVSKHYKINAGFGVKNPGTFSTINGQYQLTKSKLKLNYSIGTTYQEGFTLEQNISLNYTPRLTNTLDFYLSVFAVMNTDFKMINRGIQQVKIGVKKGDIMFGLAGNLDQFNNTSKTLENYGVFIKYNF
ncbi:hypothetical protein KXJ69_01500 [Aureisphaera sp. CAU 1614]|uniref:Uncharacterized protein n=1 Tax=Halomarinibacterium sedimenti TaxID=2857106 RepID=A0A9X1FLF7_9FLAO|nr:hypothetical protein [Halomarinibacterium sedimenti]MBW2936760.1 hypothetical protein [Halomarinibacterium sedimenti]